MSYNGMVEYKESFFTKIKNFFKTIFGKQKNKNDNIDKEFPNEVKKSSQNSFFNEIKSSIDNENVDTVDQKESFLKEIEGNEEMLNMLSIDRLKKLEKYYDEIIKQNDIKIKKMKESA